VHLAFQWWSIPLFAVLAVGVVALVTSMSATLPAWGKRVLRGTAVLLASILTWFAWWVNQGNPNWIGSLLYGYALIALALVAGLLGGLAALASRRRSTV
jgi:hypothetical protein